VVNGVVNATEVSGSVNVAVTNGTISGKVFIPENGSCILSLVNGNVSLLVPRTTSATVSATVTLGTVSVSNLPMTYTTNTPVVVTGVLSGGKGSIRLSTVTGVVQLVGM
jgi:predicted membrane protein